MKFLFFIPFVLAWESLFYFQAKHFPLSNNLVQTEPSALDNFLQSPIVFGICLVGYFALVLFVKTKQFKAGEAL